MRYHDEEASIDNVKAWWSRWGNLTTWVLTAVLVVAATWNGWNFWQRHQASAASGLYEAVQQAFTSGDKAKIARAVFDMEDKYGSTAYAQMTALESAKGLYMAGDSVGARAQLQWVIDHAKDDEYKQIAKLRLASLLLDEKAYDAGLALLNGPPDEGFNGLIADRRGDLLVAQGKRAAARAAYQLALDSLPKVDQRARQLVQFKLDALGS
ncbi:MAG: tetratricopeptide repeat protein [Burkholderia sp.]|nr:MAG: hypothetical protein E5299_00824 [Burkholderia gladioli]